MWLLVVCLETRLKASVAEPILAAQQMCSWHRLFLYRISAETVGKHYGVLDSSESREAEERGQLLPARQPCWGASVCLSPGQAKQGEQGVHAQPVARDHVSS